MTQAEAVLIIHILEHDRLIDIFGIDAINHDLNDFGEAIHGLIKRLLAQHEVLEHNRLDAQGRWFARFRLAKSGLPRDIRETYAAIEEAGRKLMHDHMLAIFGAGSGMRIPVVLAVLPFEAKQANAACPPGWIDAQLTARPPKDLQYHTGDTSEVTEILSKRTLRTLLQPIVNLHDRTIVGYEALSRGPQGSPLERPDRLFNAAHAVGRTIEMELLCAELALERVKEESLNGKFLTINLGPEALAHAADHFPLSGGGGRNVLFELTEHLPLDQAEELAEAVARLRTLGIGLALDDTGCGFADMDTVRVLQPEIVKLCITVVRNADKGPQFMIPIQETARRLNALGCRVLAEGVETEAQHTALTESTIELAQGWLYAKPAPVEKVLDQTQGSQG